MNVLSSFKGAPGFCRRNRLYDSRLWTAVGVALGIILSAWPGVTDETNITVNAAQVLTDALHHSLTLKLSEQDVTAAKARTIQARSQLLPTLNLNSHGGHYEGLKDGSVVGFDDNVITIPSVANWYGASATLSQPLFIGGQLRQQKINADFQYNATTQTWRSVESDVRRQALSAYWNWSKSFYALETLRAAVTRMEVHAADMRNFHDAGLATDNDTLSTEVLLDKTRLYLEEAKRYDEIARAQIAFLTGYDLPSNAVPDRPVIPVGLTMAPELEFMNAARTNRAEYAVRRLEVNAASARVDMHRAGYWPQLYLTASYEYDNPNPRIVPPQEEWNGNFYAGLALTWNILDWGLTHGKVSEATAQATKAKLRLAQEDERIVLEVRRARIILQDALQSLKVAKRAEQSAQRNLESATILWNNGLLRHSELLDAHTKLTQAQYDAVSARANIVLAQTALDYAAGRLNGEP